QAVRSIEYGPLSKFFSRTSELPAELANYLASFDLIISYLYDPDRVFENNLRRCGVENLLSGPPKIIENAGHAARQLAQPSGKIEMSVSQKIYRCLISRQCSRARSSLDTIAESRISLPPRARTASCSSVRPIPVCGHRVTKTCKFFARQTGTSAMWKLDRSKQ